NILFIEAARMMKYRYRKDVLVLMVSYVPIPANLGEMKTKPTQYASRTLNESGIQADFIIARGEKPLDEPRRRKIATLCNMESREDIISCPDVGNIYDVPMILKKQNLDQLILEKLGIHTQKDDISAWNELLEKIRKARSSVKIAIVGKYFTTGGFILADVYVSVIEAIKHGCYAMGVRPEMEWIDSQVFEDEPEKLNMLDDFDGLVVPGGFGTRAVDGIISAVKYARENKTPYLGLCYGMQLAAVEYARNVCGITNANSLEIDKDTDEPVINLMSDQVKKLLGKKYGGTMRLGAYPCELKPGTIAGEIYKRNMISERHRHRYEFNNKYKEIMEEKGLVFSGWNPDLGLVEIIELKKQDHPFFMGVQFHPEFKSRPLSPHPVFVNYIKACKEKKMKW
ncbi:MAG: CTP synthase, partial [Vulcanimicrobiota bacterium]